MKGIILNEEGHKTLLYNIFKNIEKYVRNLNWRIMDECCSGPQDQILPFEGDDDVINDGDSLYDILAANPKTYMYWGLVAGFPKNVSIEEIKKAGHFQISDEFPYLDGGVHHYNTSSVFEIICFDGTETYVIADDEKILNELKSSYPKWEDLDKYV